MPAEIVVRYERGAVDPGPPETRISKLYRLHRVEPSFRAVFDSPTLTNHLLAIVGGDVDLFLSQIVFKLPGALGQPWHQDAAIFPFDPPGPVVGVWCALTDARAPSSQLSLQPGSHRTGGRPHGRDRAHPTGGRYVMLIDQRVSDPEVVDLAVGDGVVFDSRTVHTSTDNRSDRSRVAATAHFAKAGTVDRTESTYGANPYNDWLPWIRHGQRIRV
jgi:ectoine hydroxylase-related dioxygenase (phytanoyl-CoA dioxygenase family)